VNLASLHILIELTLKNTYQADESQYYSEFPLRDEPGNAGVRPVGLSTVGHKGQGGAMTAPHVLTFRAQTQTGKLALPIATERPTIDGETPERPLVQIRCNKLPEVPQATVETTLKRFETRKAITTKIAGKIARFDVPRAEKILHCSSKQLIREYDDGRVRHGSTTAYCGSKFCLECARRRASRIASAYQPIITEQRRDKHAYHLTLTLDSCTGEDLPNRKDISKMLRNLFRRKVWRQFGGVAGGLYSIESTRNTTTGLYHPHIHVLLITELSIGCQRNGDFHVFINQQISDAWKSITGGAFIVHGNQLRSGVNEICKYISKFGSVESIPDEEFEAFYTWARSMRLTSSFGCLYGKLTEKQERELEEGNDAGDEEMRDERGTVGYIDRLYEFRPSLGRAVLIEERRYVPTVGNKVSTMVIMKE
jgi:plasmid rolling circle replication initiator protein Rep